MSTRPERDQGRAGTDPALPWLAILLTAVAVGVWLLPDSGAGLAYQRGPIADGELWRLVTGHFVHWSPGHLVWDVGTFLVLGVACELRSRKRFSVCLVGSVVAIPCTVWLLLPELELYAGLSGVDSALFALLGADLVHEQWKKRNPAVLAIALGLSLALAFKVGFEITTGGTIFVADLASGIVPVPRAHLAGALVGLLASASIGGSRSGPSRLSTASSYAVQRGGA